jgi:hypothetical protein
MFSPGKHFFKRRLVNGRGGRYNRYRKDNLIPQPLLPQEKGGKRYFIKPLSLWERGGSKGTGVRL